jgi:hypothetical protein
LKHVVEEYCTGLLLSISEAPRPGLELLGEKAVSLTSHHEMFWALNITKP